MSRYPLLAFLAAAILWCGPGPACGDEIILQDGRTLTGRIVHEGDDIVRIEITVTDTIRETRTVPRSEISEIVKTPPDEVAFAEVEPMVPTRSLMDANAYRSALERGPNAFLASFPDSAHAPRVREIKEQLEEELAKVQRGFVKIEDDWISPEERREFSALVDSRIRLLQMRSHADRGGVNGSIAALREFQAIEDRYFGSPAFPDALELALRIIPSFGQQLQRMLADVDIREQEHERRKAAMDEIAQREMDAARAREIESYQQSLERDKQAGIKWVQLDPRSKKSLEDYVKLATDELTRLRQFDIDALRRQAERIEEADRLVAAGNASRAQARLNQALEIEVRGASAAKSRARSSRSRTRTGPTSYIAHVSAKIDEFVAEETAKAKAAAKASKSKTATADLRRASGKAAAEAAPAEAAPDPDPAAAEEPVDPAPAAETADPDSPPAPDAEPEAEPTAAEEAEAAPRPAPDAFAALAGKRKKAVEEAPAAAKAKPSAKTPAREERPAPPQATGGGFPTTAVMIALFALLLVAAVALKMLGIGGKKEEAEGEGE